MAKKANSTNLLEENPELYYKKKKTTLTIWKFVVSIAPPLLVLGIYSVLSFFGATGTNPLNPLKFGIGSAMTIVGIVILLGIELKNVSNTSKEDNDGEGIDFKSTIVWLYVTTLLWLFYITIFWLIMLGIAEFLGSFAGAFITAEIKKCKKSIEKENTADVNAKAMYRVNKQMKEKEESVPTE